MSVPLRADDEAQPYPRRSLSPARRGHDPDVARRGAALARALLAARKGCYEDDGQMIHGPGCQCEPPF
jgi:hypothetical protein